MIINTIAFQGYKKPLALGIASLGILMLFGMAVKYLLWIGFIDHGEVTMAATAWLFVEGKPIYTDLSAMERYSIQHGPMIYMLMGFIMKSLGPSILTAKLTGFLLIGINIILAWFCFRKLVKKEIAFGLVGLEAWILLKWQFIFFSRDDSIMLLGVTMGLFFLQIKSKSNRVISLLGFAAAMGILMGSKIHSIIYFFPILAMWYLREGWKRTVMSLILAVIIGGAPFIAANVSLMNYTHWLMLSRHHGFIGRLFLCNLLYLGVLFLIPIGIGLYYKVQWSRIWKEGKLVIVATAISGIAIAFIGSKAGSGNYHLIPFVPLCSYFTARMIVYLKQAQKAERFSSAQRWASVLLIVIGCIILGSGINNQKRMLSIIHKYPAGIEVIEEIGAIEKMYTGNTLEIGFGSDHSYKQLRSFIPIPVFKGNPYLFDGAALMDMQVSGLKLPPATLEALKNGVVQIWLIPTGEKPFRLCSYYCNEPQMILDDAAQAVFLQNYILVNQMKYFDVWKYNSNTSSSK